ncbi:MAG TPA: carboxypeptidase regulatory-like domain-containing protein [Verrucomicrobiae bacterium]|nr:carboxypeptidase regulatory-like domain-containing protein [Verrucomicrobiae bacterium]
MGLKLCFATVFTFAALLPGQEFRATITGHVTDASGAIVPQAKVQAINRETNVAASALTNTQGVYTIPLLQPGSYNLVVEAPGFKKYVRQQIVLDIGNVAGIDVTLDVGNANESVTVTAEASTPLLETETADRGLVVNETEILQLPLNGRNPFMLSVLSAGVNYNGSQQFQRPFDNGAIANWSINGGLQNMNEFLLDGAPNNAQAGGNNLAFVTPVDSVSEFKVQTTSYDAEYGKTAGGVVNVSTKNGTNQLHGSVYEFMRRTPLDALTPAEIDNAAQFGTPNTTVDYLNQYGFSLGGPVRIPKIYNGRDKTFFFVNYERYYQDNPQVEEYSMPTLQELGLAPGEMGVYDFSGLNNPATDGGTPVTIYNPFSTAANGFTPGAVSNSAGTNVTRSPLLISNPFYGGSCPATPQGIPAGTFSCNTTSPTIQGIPASMVNPIGLGIARLLPTPNQNGVTAQNATRYGTSDYGLQASDNPFLGNGEDHFYNFISRVDQNFGSNDRVYVRFGSNDRHQQNIGTPLTGVGTTGQNPLIRANKAISADWSRTITPTLISDLRVSFSRYIEASDSTADASVTPAFAGFPSSVVAQIPYKQAFGTYSITNYQNLGKDVANTNWTNTKALAAKIIKVMGKHSFKAGLDFRWIQENFVNVGNTFNLGFADTWTQQSYNTATTGSGDGLASLLLGLPTSFEADNLAEPSYLSTYYAGYFQDDWKLTPRLTVNLGLRYDIFPAVTERDGELTNGWLSNQTNPINGAVQGAVANFSKATTATGAPLYTAAQISAFNTAFPNGLPALMGGLSYVHGGSGRDGVTDFGRGLQPRVGAAYAVNKKLVVRGGVARYMINPTNDWYQNPPPGYSQNTSYGTTALSTGAPLGGIPFGSPCASSSIAGCSGNLLANPFAVFGSGGLPLPPGNSLGAETFLGNSVNFFNQNFQPGWVLEYSFGFQYSLPWQSRIEVSYVGNRGYGLESNNTYNVIPLGLRQQCDPLEGGNPNVCNTVVPNPFYNLPQFAGSTLGGSATTTVAQLSMPYPEFAGGTESGLNLGSSWYKGLEVTYTIRARRGLTLTVAYTLSRATEAGGFPSSSAGSNQNSDAGQSYIDVQKQILERSVAPYDLPNVLKISSVYQLPFGKGRRFLGSANRLLDAIVGGWEHNMLMQYNSGRPWNLPGNIIFYPEKGTPYAAARPVKWDGPNNIVQGVRPCVGVMSASGQITLESYSTANGNPYNCSVSNINFLSIPTSIYAPSSEAGLRTSDIRTQGALVADMSLAKTFHIWERVSFQFRAEAFNVFNTPWLAGTQFNGTVTSASFGTITKSSSQNGAAYPSREIQLGFKMTF